MLATVEQTLDRHLVGFVDVLRRSGLDVPLGSTLEFGRAVAAVGAGTRSGVYWAGRATLVRRPEDVGTYNEAFQRHWMGAVPGKRVTTEQPTITLLLDVADDADGDRDQDERHRGAEIDQPAAIATDETG